MQGLLMPNHGRKETAMAGKYYADAVEEADGNGKWFGEVRERIVPAQVMSVEDKLLSRKGPYPSKKDALAWAQQRKQQGPPWN